MKAANHLEVVGRVQLLQYGEIHCPGWVFGGDEDAEDLLTLLVAWVLARL